MEDTNIQKKNLLIVDGNSILNRAYYGIRSLTALDGTPTNAVYGFLNILLKYLEENRPDYLGVAFDLKAPTFRHKMYPQYKAQRKPAPEELIVQIPLMKEVLASMDVKCVELEGYEADDIIGTISRVCDESDVSCSILTGDKDDLQLASNNTTVKLVVTRMGKTTTTDYDDKAVKEHYGVTPHEYIDVKGLMGDPSDNIPGVKGIGEKTAFSLIRNYSSIEYIYENIEDLDVTNAVRNKLLSGKDSAYMSKTLATIDREVPVGFDFDDYEYKNPDKGKMSEIFVRLGFKSFMKKFNLDEIAEEKHIIEKIDAHCSELDTEAAFKMITDAGEVYCYFGNNPSDLFVSVDGEKIYHIDVNGRDDFLKAVFGDETILKYGFDLKSDILALSAKGIDYSGLGFDVMIAAYINNPSGTKYDIGSLCYDHLGINISAEDTDKDVQLSMDDFYDELKEGSNILTGIIRLKKYFENDIKNNEQEYLYYKIELPLIKILADMQIHGVYVDKEELIKFGDGLKRKIAELTELIFEEAGEEFNIKSPKQLGSILFDKLNLSRGKKNHRGYSTSIDVLNKLVDEHPIVNHVIEYRALTKLDSTYVDGLLAVINPDTGRIHSSFNQTVTATGRISSTEPNLQNIPVRTELGRELRRMFAAGGEDKILVDADYSQIELRVLASISGDENMCEAFRHGDDIHRRTASQVFGVPFDEVTDTMRFRAKAVNFGIVYGIGAYSLAQDLKISRKEADTYIKGYLMHYPLVDKYMKDIVLTARRDGYVKTLYNRRRYLPELRNSNKITQAFGERVARNAPIQGTAADIIKIAMVNVYSRLKSEGLRSKLILQVHDELIVEAEKDELEAVERIVKEEMQNAVTLKVPLPVELNSGRSWYDTK